MMNEDLKLEIMGYAVSGKEEFETVEKYFDRMIPGTESVYGPIIAEELKHILQFVEGIVEKSGIRPEGYEVEKDDEEN